MILEIHLCFFSKEWGIKHRFSEHVMAGISHSFYFYLLCNRCHTQTQQIKIKKGVKVMLGLGESEVLRLLFAKFKGR